jgi:hypothetical protein
VAGLVELPCLSDWDEHSTDLLTLLQIARITFSENPPVFTRPKIKPKRRHRYCMSCFLVEMGVRPHF